MFFTAYYSQNVIKKLISAIEASMKNSIGSIINNAIGNLIIYVVAIIIFNFFVYSLWIYYMKK